MADFALPNTWVMDVPLTLTDPATNAAVPVPAGDVFTVVSARPASLNAVMATDASGAQVVRLNAMVVMSTPANGGGDITVTVTDSAGDTAGLATFDIIVPASAANIGLNLTAVTHTVQAAPTAPGP